MIAATTLLITLASGVAMHLVDSADFPTVGDGLWWAAQTVTTVGYGDNVPESTAGRVLAFIVMLNAIALVTVVTGSVTVAMIEGTRLERLRAEEGSAAGGARPPRRDAADRGGR